jgi:ligand-binding sensor domain-containing protein
MNGLNYFDQGTEQFVLFNVVNKNDSSLTSKSISKMIVNGDGSMWIATFNNGLYKMHIENESFQKIYSPLEEPYRVENASIWYMIISGTGYLWLGPLGKDLILFDTATYHSKIIEFASSSSEGARISTMIEDKDGILWIGTFNSGLFKIQLTNKEVKIVNHYLNNQRNQDSLSYNNICDIIKPSVVDTNALWIGTASGINTLDLKTNSLTLNCFAYKKSGLVMVILGMI